MKGNQRILVVGSTNIDMVIRSPRLPRPGKTILGGTFFMAQGGKGANQAVSIARLGAEVIFVTKIGQDIFGDNTRKILQNEGIDDKYLLVDPVHPSGVALITVDNQAENCIVVSSGANEHLLSVDLEKIPEVIKDSEIILLQLEIPLETVEYIAEEAFNMGKKVVLNPAPARPLSQNLLKKLYLITPNETEAELISGVKITNQESAQKAAMRIHELGVSSVIITLGAKGALIYSDSLFKIVPAISYGLGQGATLVSALWGIFIWKKFRGASKTSHHLNVKMFVSFLIGLGFLVYAGSKSN